MSTPSLFILLGIWQILGKYLPALVSYLRPVKVLSVSARHNPCQGGLSQSFLLEVQYKIGAKKSLEAWFVKVPKSLQSVAMDQRELVMYNKIFPRLQVTRDSLEQS